MTPSAHFYCFYCSVHLLPKFPSASVFVISKAFNIMITHKDCIKDNHMGYHVHFITATCYDY